MGARSIAAAARVVTSALRIPGVVLVLPLLLASAGCDDGRLPRAKVATAGKICLCLDQAVLAFEDEYRHLPGALATVSDGSFTTDSPEGGRFLNILCGMEPKGQPMENIKRIRFFEAPEARDGRSGLRYTPDGTAITALFDPWGQPYKVQVEPGQQEPAALSPPAGMPGRKVSFYSFGKNRRDEGGNGDDIGH